MEDTLYPLLKIYRQLPYWVQSPIGLAYRLLPNQIRYGVFYDEYQKRIINFINATNSSDILRMQLALLAATVNNAIDSIPFYRNFPKIKSFNDLKIFPVINKTDIASNTKTFVSEKYGNKRLKANTGGSSGTPMAFYLHSGKTRPKEQAHFDWFWAQHGFIPGSRILMVRGAPLKNNALYEYQAIKNCLAVSCYTLNSSNIEKVLLAVNKFQPQFIHGYPSAVKNLIKCIEENDAVAWVMPMKALFLGSEWLSVDDRNNIEDFFKARVISWYGHSECAIMGGNSIDSKEYFFYPFYGYTELLGDDDKPIQKPGAIGRIVATSFDNFVMPFIRYDTGDLGVLSDKNIFGAMPCLVLKKIEGREQDIIYLKDNTRVSLTAFIFGQHLPQFASIREMQLEQNVAGCLILRIVPDIGYELNDECEILNRLRKSVSEKIDIEFEYVKKIEKTHRGKHRFLIQKIKD